MAQETQNPLQLIREKYSWHVEVCFRFFQDHLETISTKLIGKVELPAQAENAPSFLYFAQDVNRRHLLYLCTVPDNAEIGPLKIYRFHLKGICKLERVTTCAKFSTEENSTLDGHAEAAAGYLSAGVYAAMQKTARAHMHRLVNALPRGVYEAIDVFLSATLKEMGIKSDAPVTPPVKPAPEPKSPPIPKEIEPAAITPPPATSKTDIAPKPPLITHEKSRIADLKASWARVGGSTITSVEPPVKPAPEPKSPPIPKKIKSAAVTPPPATSKTYIAPESKPIIPRKRRISVLEAAYARIRESRIAPAEPPKKPAASPMAARITKTDDISLPEPSGEAVVIDKLQVDINKGQLIKIIASTVSDASRQVFHFSDRLDKMPGFKVEIDDSFGNHETRDISPEEFTLLIQPLLGPLAYYAANAAKSYAVKATLEKIIDRNFWIGESVVERR